MLNLYDIYMNLAEFHNKFWKSDKNALGAFYEIMLKWLQARKIGSNFNQTITLKINKRKNFPNHLKTFQFQKNLILRF